MGRIQEREEMARAARDQDSASGAEYKVSYVEVTGFMHPFGVRILCDPWELSDRLRAKLNHCAGVFLRRCGLRINRKSNAVLNEERES
jgi:hypothetical protein